MTDHTYAGHTAAQIRAAAEAASPGTWREQRYMSNGQVGYGIVDGGRGLFIGEHRLMPFCETDRRHIVTSQPATVLALLDRIAELEQRANAAEGWHLIETGRADELQANVNLNRDEIAGLRVQNDLLLAACRKAVLALGHAAERHPVYRRDYDALSAAIDAARAQPAE